MLDQNCLFCKIIQGTIPAAKVYEDEYTIAFNDIAPRAPVHILVIPKTHHASIHEIPEGESEIVQQVFAAVCAVVKQEKLTGDGYRLVVNYGEQSGQAVPHLHVHVLGGRAMHWPPG